MTFARGCTITGPDDVAVNNFASTWLTGSSYHDPPISRFHFVAHANARARWRGPHVSTCRDRLMWRCALPFFFRPAGRLSACSAISEKLALDQPLRAASLRWPIFNFRFAVPETSSMWPRDRFAAPHDSRPPAMVFPPLSCATELGRGIPRGSSTIGRVA